MLDDFNLRVRLTAITCFRLQKKYISATLAEVCALGCFYSIMGFCYHSKMGIYVNGGSPSMAYVINGHLRNELYFIALRAKLLGAVYCNRSCL